MAETTFRDIDIKNIEARIQYTLAELPSISLWLLEMATIGEDVYLCHRRDYHEDGSATHYYYLELNEAQFKGMGGKSLSPMENGAGDDKRNDA